MTPRNVLSVFPGEIGKTTAIKRECTCLSVKHSVDVKSYYIMLLSLEISAEGEGVEPSQVLPWAVFKTV